MSVYLFLWVKHSHFQSLLSLVPLGSRIWLREWGRGGSLTWQVGHREPSSGGWEAGLSFFRLVFDVTTGLPSASQRFAGAVPAPLDEKGWLSGGHLPWGAEWGEGSLTDSDTSGQFSPRRQEFGFSIIYPLNWWGKTPYPRVMMEAGYVPPLLDRGGWPDLSCISPAWLLCGCLVPEGQEESFKTEEVNGAPKVRKLLRVASLVPVDT